MNLHEYFDDPANRPYVQPIQKPVTKPENRYLVTLRDGRNFWAFQTKIASGGVLMVMEPYDRNKTSNVIATYAPGIWQSSVMV